MCSGRSLVKWKAWHQCHGEAEAEHDPTDAWSWQNIPERERRVFISTLSRECWVGLSGLTALNKQYRGHGEILRFSHVKTWRIPQDTNYKIYWVFISRYQRLHKLQQLSLVFFIYFIFSCKIVHQMEVHLKLLALNEFTKSVKVLHL